MTNTPEELVRAGRIEDSLRELQTRVRSNPADAKDRVFLFQLLALSGQWDRAAAQLKVAADLDPATLILRQIYRGAVEAEAMRAKVFDGGATPTVLGEPPAWMGGFLEALRLAAKGHWSQAAELRTKALEDAPASGGAVNGERFDWIADADTRIGPCLEIILDGKYLWAPFERVHSIRMEPPTDLRDAVWSQAIVTWENGGQTPALIPARYPGTERSEDDAARLSRRTDWRTEAGDSYLGIGQRMWTTDANDYPLLDVREVIFDARTSSV